VFFGKKIRDDDLIGGSATPFTNSPLFVNLLLPRKETKVLKCAYV
jgi:hypothetical protein